MNTPIRRLFALIVVLFAALAAATSWWTVVRADDLNRDYTAENQRDVLRGRKIPRGVIRTADGTTIARSIKRADGTYVRRYPLGSTFAHPVGYSFTISPPAGLEAYYNHDLSRGAATTPRTLLDGLLGRNEGGDDLTTRLDGRAQSLARRLIAGASPEHGGAMVALDPRNGAVKVMASVPGFNPNRVRTQAGLDRLNHAKGDPQVNRAVQFGYQPGSTMKVVTLAAALDSGKFTPSSQVDGSNNVKISGVALQNDLGDEYGRIDLTTALTSSVNTVFAQVAVEVGKPTMRRYMERFGFGRKPELDYPKDAMSASGEYRNGRPIPSTSRYVDVGRMGIGQDKLLVTPLQMALVAAGVANHGKLMKPRLGGRFVDADGRTSKRIEPELQATVMKRSTADAITKMMVNVVDNGTGRSAQIPGIKVAGKTGTAETESGPGQKNKLWFIAFAPADRPRIAVAVTLDGVVGFGGQFAAPIAKSVMQELLKR